ncbi:uncharacterized protein LOC128671053 [Plodia interpunctella]|uniref:uncharacterized protein LOC128671053 n=1 Tax=Plodia interpunctella TaxID=58824 RepID=UPI00236745E1|nr:uncharacterized protein LOC128671053 [Plodia interpunctella]
MIINTWTDILDLSLEPRKVSANTRSPRDLIAGTVTECAEQQMQLNANDRIVVKLDPEQVVAAFRSVVSSDYMRNLARDLAAKVAEHYLVQMKEQTTAAPVRYREPPLEPARQLAEAPTSANAEKTIKDEVMLAIEGAPPKERVPADLNTSIIDVKQAMTLLKAPSPDGDNLDMVSPNLSDDEETKAKKKGTQVIQLMKVNGKYYRRLLGVV